MTVYIAGPITGDPEYMDKFTKADEHLVKSGHKVLNPAYVSGWVGKYLGWRNVEYDHKDWMETVIPLLRHAEGIYLLRGWEHSPGAVEEHELAKRMGLTIMYEEAENGKN